jgi:aminopeptidase N
MELRVLDGTDPSWPVWLDFEEWKQRALEKDALQATHAIRTPVASPEEAQENFDAITYSKGASGLRMLEAWLGEEPFRAGVSRYLREHLHGNATAEDLWRALGESAMPAQAAEVGRVARSWFEQPGLPLVEVNATCEGARTRLDVTQRRFYADGRGQSTQLWRLPLCVRGGDGKPACTLVTEASARVMLDGCDARPVVNPDHVGFYRVKYDAATLRAHARSALSLKPAERIALVSDVEALAEQGALPASAVLDVALGLRGERNEQVLEALAETLEHLGDNLVADGDRAAFRRFVASIYAPIVRELGWDPRPGEDDRRRLLRKLALLALGVTARDPAVVAEARRRLPAYLDDPAAADGSVGDALVEIAVRSGDAQLVDRLLVARRRASTPEHERRLTYALAAFEEPAAVARALAQLLGAEVRVQDMARLLAKFLGNPSAQKAAWRFFADNLTRLRDKAPGHAGLERAVDALGNLCDPAARREIAAFFSDPAHKIDAADRALKEALEQIDECVAWKARGTVEVSRWLMKILNAAG